jgi:hypothetical protein
MSSKLRPLLQRLLECVSRAEAPVFHEAELLAIDPAGLHLLRQERVLMDNGIATEIEHPQNGSMLVRKLGSGWVLVDPQNPARDLISVDVGVLRLLRFSHVALLEWIARTNGMAGESTTGGDIWTVGTANLGGSRCRVLYFPGIASRDHLLLALRNFSAESSAEIQFLLMPAAIKLSSNDLAWIESKRLYVEPLYRLAVDNGFDLSRARVPQSNRRGAEYCFRRSGAGWEVGFDTTIPRAVPDKAGMVQIWFLLRNPKKEFTAIAINNDLNAAKEVAHSSGTRARTIADLPVLVKRQLRNLLAEMQSAKENNDERAERDAKEEYSQILKQNGIKDTFAGKGKRDGDDDAKEGDTMRKAIERSIVALRKTPELRSLAQHLDTCLKRGARFSYEPPEIPPWRTA